MKTKLAVMAALMIATVSSIASGQQTPSDKSRLADNAALVYWQAFALVPELNDAQRKAVDAVLDGEKPSAEVTKVLRQASESLRLLQRAAEYPQCEWGLDYDRGLEMSLPHLSQSRKLARLACARARLRFEKQDDEAAIADIAGVMAMAKSVGKDPVIIALLVQYAIADQAGDVLAEALPQLEADQLARLAQLLKAPAGGTSMADCCRTEKNLLLGWFIRELRKPGGKKRVLSVFPDPENPNVIALKALAQDEMLGAAESLNDVYDKIVEAMALPPAEFDESVERLKSGADTLGPGKHLAALTMPSLQSLRDKEVGHLARQRMMLAAVLVAKDGPDALQRSDVQDLFDAGPFQYDATDGGFRLTSKIVDQNGEPVTLVVGPKR